MQNNKGLEITHTPELGPNCLSMAHNDREAPLTVKDALELMRWMRGDLRRVTAELKTAYETKLRQDEISGVAALNESIVELIRISRVPWWKKIFGRVE